MARPRHGYIDKHQHPILSPLWANRAYSVVLLTVNHLSIGGKKSNPPSPSPPKFSGELPRELSPIPPPGSANGTKVMTQILRR